MLNFLPEFLITFFKPNLSPGEVHVIAVYLLTFYTLVPFVFVGLTTYFVHIGIMPLDPAAFVIYFIGMPLVYATFFAHPLSSTQISIDSGVPQQIFFVDTDLSPFFSSSDPQGAGVVVSDYLATAQLIKVQYPELADIVEKILLSSQNGVLKALPKVLLKFC